MNLRARVIILNNPYWVWNQKQLTNIFLQVHPSTQITIHVLFSRESRLLVYDVEFSTRTTKNSMLVEPRNQEVEIKEIFYENDVYTIGEPCGMPN